MIKASAVGLALLLPTWATVAQDFSLSGNGDISVNRCAYGRGAPAIEQAKASALAEISRVVSSSKVLSVATTREELSSATMEWLQQLTTLQQEGIDLRGLRTQVSTPELMGSDTCVTVTLVKQPVSKNSSATAWNNADTTVSVTVVGEGWRDNKQGISARENAELDALRRAISQVVGVWLTEQRTQYSNSAAYTSETQNSMAMSDFVAQQLQTKSSGMVKQWRLVDSKTLPNNGVEVTIRADVKKQKIALASANIMQQIGSPRVSVTAPSPLDNELKQWLSKQGVELSDKANLLLVAEPRMVERNGTSRLDLRVTVNDRAGNQYGSWRNDSSLIALPSSDTVLYDLIDVHLSLEEQSKGLRKQLGDAFVRVVQEGGLLHDIWINSDYLAQPDRLSSVLSTLGGAKDVSVAHDGQFYKAQLRFSGKTGDLVAALRQSLQPIIAVDLPKATVANEFSIRFN